MDFVNSLTKSEQQAVRLNDFFANGLPDFVMEQGKSGKYNSDKKMLETHKSLSLYNFML